MTDESDNTGAETGQNDRIGQNDRPEPGALVPQPHGGAIRYGNVKGGVPGGMGRPKDVIRARLRQITDEQGVQFLAGVLDGRVSVQFVGTCPKCKTTTTAEDFDQDYLRWLQSRIEATTDHQLKASEQALKYGLGTQTETVTPEDVAQTAQRMLAVLVDELVSRGWPLPDVQALAAKMASAAKGDDAAGA